jgi:hypothetical protein
MLPKRIIFDGSDREKEMLDVTSRQERKKLKAGE